MVDEKGLADYIEKAVTSRTGVTASNFRKSRYQPDGLDEFNYVIDVEDKGDGSFAFGKCNLSFSFDKFGVMHGFNVCLRGYPEKTEEYCKAYVDYWDRLDETKQKQLVADYQKKIFNNKSQISLEYFNFPTNFSNFVKADINEIENCIIECGNREHFDFTEDEVKSAFENNEHLIMLKYDGNLITCNRVGKSDIVYVFNIKFTRGDGKFVYSQSFSTGFIDKVIQNLTTIYYDLDEQGWSKEAEIIGNMIECFCGEL